MDHQAPCESTPSGRTPYFVPSVHFGLLLDTKSVEFLMREIRLACWVLSRRAPEAILDFAKLFFGWLRKLFAQKRGSEG